MKLYTCMRKLHSFAFPSPIRKRQYIERERQGKALLCSNFQACCVLTLRIYSRRAIRKRWPHCMQHDPCQSQPWHKAKESVLHGSSSKISHVATPVGKEKHKQLQALGDKKQWGQIQGLNLVLPAVGGSTKAIMYV